MEDRYILRVSFYVGDADFKVEGTVLCNEEDKTNFERGIEIARLYLQKNEDFWIPLSETIDDRFYTEKLDKAFSFEKISEKEHQALGKKRQSTNSMQYKFFEFFEGLGLDEDHGGIDFNDIYYSVFEGYVKDHGEDRNDNEDV